MNHYCEMSEKGALLRTYTSNCVMVIGRIITNTILKSAVDS